MKPFPRKLLIWTLAAGVAAALLLVYLLLRQFEFEKIRDEYKERTAGELIRYARIRLMGHELLETVMLPALAAIESGIERPIPSSQMPSLSKGQQSFGLAPPRFLAKGQAQAEPATPLPYETPGGVNEVRVTSSAELFRAMQKAQAGQTILIAPGRYAITRPLLTGAAGEAQFPIQVRANKPGTVRLEVSSPVGFRVAHPFWVFENLNLRGVCEEQAHCEHAFHIVGSARSSVLRNNAMEDFNAHVRVNGEGEGKDQAWPDDGLLQFNSFSNSRPRTTQRVVAPIDLVGVSRWRVLDNHITGFAKSLGNQTAYGLLIRGGGHGGRVERNLLVCSSQPGSSPGIRVGLSFGGSSGDKKLCREQCGIEHSAGLASNNVIAHCNDFGIDINQATSILLAHNSLINTAGIDVRSAQSSATVYGNLLDGRIRERDGARANAGMNEVHDLRQQLQNPDGLDLRWRHRVDSVPTLPMVLNDFCGQVRGASSLPGALKGPVADCFINTAAVKELP
ncbi:hypothetical protein [Roseateles sp.]|uniref:hypothetical protein n=1 Tax=Roseateles sp. TaxID=1971397 RepID=UPI002869F0EC|nr:hypothetical protein [Roseateles sp.]